MESGFLEDGIRAILIDEYKVAEPGLVIKFHDFVKAVLEAKSLNKNLEAMQNHANETRDYESRKIALSLDAISRLPVSDQKQSLVFLVINICRLLIEFGNSHGVYWTKIYL